MHDVLIRYDSIFRITHPMTTRHFIDDTTLGYSLAALFLKSYPAKCLKDLFFTNKDKSTVCLIGQRERNFAESFFVYAWLAKAHNYQVVFQ